jgi:hypothetical protein
LGIIEDIEEQCRQGLDRCEVANPQGRCCLGNVKAVARAVGAASAGSSNRPAVPDCCAEHDGAVVDATDELGFETHAQ